MVEEKNLRIFVDKGEEGYPISRLFPWLDIRNPSLSQVLQKKRKQGPARKDGWEHTCPLVVPPS